MPIWRRKLRRMRSALPNPVSWATVSMELPLPSSRLRAASTRARSTNRAGLTPIDRVNTLDRALRGGVRQGVISEVLKRTTKGQAPQSGSAS